MKSISSSFFGRLFGNPTTVLVDDRGLSVSVKGNETCIAWQELVTPPSFSAHWLGQTMTFETAEHGYVLSKLAYSSEKQKKKFVELCWIKSHQVRLQALITKVDRFIEGRYLRQSAISQIQHAVNKEYQRWFPWVSSSDYPQEIADLVDMLADYQHCQQDDFNLYRETYIEKQLHRYQDFFNTVETNPLTLMQRRACVIDDNNNLLLAGAGTGKTSVMIGRAGYLLNSQQAKHGELLLLAYGRKAADEMDQRIKEKLTTDKISATTFHSLGLNIIAKVEGGKPNLSQFADDEKAKSKWIQDCFEQLITEQQHYRTLALEYFSRYYYVEKHALDFESLGEYYQYLKDNDIRSLKGDLVKSFGELQIANWLFNHGIEYQYEAPYQVDVKSVDRQRYQPDFFLPAFNLYIEYYSIDEDGATAPYIDAQQYHESIAWKRQTHQENSTHCIELTFADHKQDTLQSKLARALLARQVEVTRLSDGAMLANLRETGHITVFAEMLAKLVGLYKAACLDEETEKQIIMDAQDTQQVEKALALLAPVVERYQTRLNANDEIDFEDMIIKALHYVESGKFTSPWRYIMVDEFQDISEPRARLVKALRNNNRGSSVFAVGDDWQAIYRFSGADVALTTGFESYFGATTKTELDRTFRFNSKIGEVASDFVSKNPTQIKKVIHANTVVDKAAVSILRRAIENRSEQQIDEISNGALDDVLSAISTRISQPQTVYLLARFWFQLPDKTTLMQLNEQYPLLRIETQSFHASKGKESDYVVIMGLKSGKHGFPSTKATPAILDTLLAKQEKFEHAEARRLFYVALTRAKHRVYIIADMADSSVFVKELIEEHDVELNEFAITVNQTIADQIRCSVCKTGTLKSRLGRYGRFYSCSHFPRCDHKERACAVCESAMSKHKYQGFKTCLNPSCDNILPLCDQCGAEMVLRKGRNGEFWGCRNFNGNDQLSCKNSVERSKVVWPSD